MTHVLISHGLYGQVIVGVGKGIGYVESYDPDAYDGKGFATFTHDVTKALRFRSASEALAFTMQISTKRPFREDGKPNRPLRAFTIEIARLDHDA